MPRLRRATPYHRSFLFLAIYSHDRYSYSVLRPISLRFPGLRSCVASPVFWDFCNFAMKAISKLTFRLLPAYSRRNCILDWCWSHTRLPSGLDKNFASQESSSQPQSLSKSLQAIILFIYSKLHSKYYSQGACYDSRAFIPRREAFSLLWRNRIHVFALFFATVVNIFISSSIHSPSLH